MSLVTPIEAKEHLRITHTYEDALVDRLILFASDAVIDYLKRKAEDPVWDPDTAPPRVKAATLLYLEDLYANRGAELSDPVSGGRVGAADRVADGYLPPRVTALLYRLRDPALA